MSQENPSSQLDVEFIYLPVINYSMLDHDVVVGTGAVVGEEKNKGGKIAVVGAEVSINPGEVVKGGAMLYPQTEKELEKEKYEDD